MDQKTVRIKVAEVVIDVTFRYPYSERFFTDYLYEGDEESAFHVVATVEMIERERGLSRRPKGRPGPLENTAIFRAIAEEMPKHGAMLVHGSTIGVDGEAYCFIAPSGTGKSTHTRLWRQLLSDDHDVVMINDD